MPPPACMRGAALFDERAQHRVVAGDAIACSIEVDDVHATYACGGEAAEQLCRRRAGARFTRELALEQAHGLAAAQVDGRHELHYDNSRKLARKRAPSAADRSGWNWAPWKLPRLATAVNEAS